VDVYVREEHMALVNGIEIDFVTEGVKNAEHGGYSA